MLAYFKHVVLQCFAIKFCSIQKIFVTLQRAFGVCYKPAQQAGRTEKNTVRGLLDVVVQAKARYLPIPKPLVFPDLAPNASYYMSDGPT